MRMPACHVLLARPMGMTAYKCMHLTHILLTLVHTADIADSIVCYEALWSYRRRRHAVLVRAVRSVNAFKTQEGLSAHSSSRGHQSRLQIQVQKKLAARNSAMGMLALRTLEAAVARCLHSVSLLARKAGRIGLL